MATIVSVGSGKGGVGKSVVAANLAMLLAKQGKRVVLADLDVGGADAHILFGMLHPTLTLTDFIERRVDRLEAVLQPVSAHPFLQLIPGTGETLATANLPYGKKKRLIRHFKQLEADVIMVDIGAGTSYHALDFFLMADYYLAVATPDPTSVLDLYRFIKLAAIRRVLSAFLVRDAVSDALSDRDFSSVEEVIQAVEETDSHARETAAKTLERIQPHLIAGQCLEAEETLERICRRGLEHAGRDPRRSGNGAIRTDLPAGSGNGTDLSLRQSAGTGCAESDGHPRSAVTYRNHSPSQRTDQSSGSLAAPLAT